MSSQPAQRQFHYNILPQIKTRFSARALNGQPLSQDVLNSLVEAASFAPSCFNEQPWRFVVATGKRFNSMLSTLTEKNQSWAKAAGALLLLISKKTFTRGGSPNPWHMSDAGCAAGFLMLEAERQGLYAHPMAGFSKAKARALFAIDEDYDLVEVIAVGEPGRVEDLPPALQEVEYPKPRKHYDELML